MYSKLDHSWLYDIGYYQAHGYDHVPPIKERTSFFMKKWDQWESNRCILDTSGLQKDFLCGEILKYTQQSSLRPFQDFQIKTTYMTQFSQTIQNNGRTTDISHGHARSAFKVMEIRFQDKADLAVFLLMITDNPYIRPINTSDVL